MNARGVAIDDADMPDWAQRYLSVDQLTLNRGLKWILLIYESKTLKPSRVSMAQRLHIGTEGRERKELVRRSHGGLAKNLNISDQTAVDALADLEDEGWILVDRRPGRPSRYRLAWPVRDVLADGSGEDVPLCGEPTKKGQRCTRRAGWGTKHQGVGKCKVHDDEPAEPPQPLETQADGSAPMVGAEVSNHWSEPLQPLERTSPTVGDVYALSSRKSSLGVRKTPVLAVGELTDRNARAAATAPTAQPRPSRHTTPAPPSSLTARRLIAGMPRYRHAPPWARRRLAALAGQALADGFGCQAIAVYAAQLAAEARYAEHQHIPELRAALARLGRDVALGTACRDCAGDPGDCPCRSPSIDRPWTAQDQADLDATLAFLGVTAEDLQPTGTG